MRFRLSTAKLLPLLALCALPLLAWTGALDMISEQQLQGSLTAASVIYGTARGINALVSLLQGTELDLVVLTFSIGEVLDPINDLIERFSAVILLAIASLALQHILLAMVSHQIFNLLLTGLALLTAGALLLDRRGWYLTLLRTFMVAVFVRFALALVILSNHWVDSTFLRDADEARHQAMQAFQEELRETRALTLEDGAMSQSVAALQEEIAALEQEVEASERREVAVDERIRQTRRQLRQQQQAAGELCSLLAVSPTCSREVAITREQLAALQAKKDVLRADQKSALETVQEKREAITCLGKRARGEDCSIWDKLPSPPDAARIKRQIASIEADVGEFSENAIALLTSLFLKSILIPLLFIYALIRLTRFIWTAGKGPGTPGPT